MKSILHRKSSRCQPSSPHLELGRSKMSVGSTHGEHDTSVGGRDQTVQGTWVFSRALIFILKVRDPEQVGGVEADGWTCLHLMGGHRSPEKASVIGIYWSLWCT